MSSLPRELWIEIFSHLDLSCEPPYDRASDPSLLSVCLVCREFCRLAQPVLYRNISSLPLLTDKGLDWSIKLARTLIARPDLGRAVLELQIYEKAVRGLPVSVWPILRQMIASASIPPRLKQMLEDTLDSGVRCSVVASLLLLALMPRLKYLCHNLDSTVVPLTWILGAEVVDTWEDSCATHTAIANHLTELEEVRWDCSRQEQDSTDAIRRVLLHPRMKRLYVTHLCCIEGDSEDVWVPGHQFGLHKAVFYQCVLDGPFLKQLLSRCKNLRKLHFSLWSGSPSQGKHRVRMDLDRYGEILRNFGQNLVKLKLYNFDSDTYPISGKIGSLRQLECLRYLVIERKVLVGHGKYKLPMAAVLPVSLESFRCYIQPYDVQFMYQELASDMEDEIVGLIDSGKFPRLRYIEFDRCGSEREDPFTRTLEGWHIQDYSWNGMIILRNPDGSNASFVRLTCLEMNRIEG
ncbi:hypothetical protein ACHAPQ_002728 [Fusarium lateritium]